MTLIAACSFYREGPLAHTAIRSALDAEPDHIIIYEGPAGPELPDAPETDYRQWQRTGKVTVKTGTWRADAEKRTALVEYVRALQLPPPCWTIWIDGDEALENGRYLRDHVQHLAWMDEERGATLTDPENLPTMGYPIAIMEPHGRLSICRAKVIRLDLVKQYVVSSSVVETVLGGFMGEGNKPLKASEWFEPRAVDFTEEEDAMYAYPPQPGVPFLVHRHHLRHPLRQGVRMSVQEGVEFARESAARGIEVAE